MTSLMKEPCKVNCNRNADFKITFLINSIILIDADYYKDVDKIISITWDGNVFRSMLDDPPNGWQERLLVHCTSQQLSEKFKSCPIIMNLSTEDNEEIGEVKIPISNCFCDALICENFKVERMNTKFTLYQGEEESALIDIDVIVQRSELDGSALDSLEKSTSKDFQMTNATQSETTTLSGELLYSDFACPDELSDECKQNLALGGHFYRIINGHLVNIKEKRGFCGNICETAKKYCKELSETESRKPSSVDILKHFNEMKTNVECREEKQTSFDKIREFLKKKFETPKDIEIPKKSTKKSKKIKKVKKKKCGEKKKPLIEEKVTAHVDKIKKQSFGRYSYDYGDSYPFHRRSECTAIKSCESVPSNMGWRHDKIQFENNKSWYPGRINKIVRILMKHHLNPYPYDTITLSNANRKMKIDGSSSDDDDNCELKSTLRMMKRNGEIFIQMRPLKEGKELETDCDPYLNCSPLKFSIRKRPEELKKHKARKIIKSRGFERKCKCCDLKSCRCMSYEKKILLQDELKKVSKELGLIKELQYEDIHSSSDSDEDFNFTTPTAIITKCRPNITHISTQYDIKDFVEKKLKFVSKLKV
ncbi:hypothetical protein PVAND_005062 [Polypedilum vanderplanki]|uniref:DUF4776 domain-containing protein n=1 Tax=Polypedilum vanderplanki TaxID=319348 RepID=A0A9J6BZX2_POLVA|nr:hypothetical protein PVAND_005062 [Polypedilum vanderplanki]